MIQRVNGFAVTQAILIQNAVSALFAKKGAEQFKKLTKRLTDG